MCERYIGRLLSHTPYWGPGPQPRHMPWPGIKPATFWFAGLHSTHWATPARAHGSFLKKTASPTTSTERKVDKRYNHYSLLSTFYFQIPNKVPCINSLYSLHHSLSQHSPKLQGTPHTTENTEYNQSCHVPQLRFRFTLIPFLTLLYVLTSKPVGLWLTRVPGFISGFLLLLTAP